MTKDEEIADLKQSLAWAQQQKTLRDEFAIAAMSLNRGYPESAVAELAYEMADAMMKERNK